MKTVVKTFMPRFAPLVQAGLKCQTVRRRPKRVRDLPSVGDKFSGREWTGAAYRTKQRLLREGTITEVRPIEISAVEGIRIGNAVEGLTAQQRDEFAKADGFKDWSDMLLWFCKQHKAGEAAFNGILIKWEPDFEP